MAVGHHRRRRSPLTGRRFLLGFGVTGAGFAAVVIAVVVGLGQVGGNQACTSKQHTSALSLAALSGPAARTGTVSGIATHYVLQGGGGNCSYAGPPSDGLFVAMSPSEYATAGACGGYLEVTGPDGSVRVKVIDQCPECATGHLDLSEPAFAELAPLKAGLINIHYTYLTDPALPGPVSIEVKPGSSQYWLSLVADNTGNPLSSVQVQDSSGGWLSLSHANYNAWNSSSSAGPGPFTVRLTDTAGNQATVRNISLSPRSVQSTGSYMYGAGSAPTTPSAAASTQASPSAPATTAEMTTAPATKARSASPSASKAARKHPSKAAPSTSAGNAPTPSVGQPAPSTASTCS